MSALKSKFSTVVSSAPEAISCAIVGSKVGRVDDHGPCLPHGVDGCVVDDVRLVPESGEDLADDADSRTLQAIGVEELRVLGENLPALAAVAGSRESTPTIAPRTAAESATVRPNGSMVSWLCEIGITPANSSKLR
jgi:hypothetical protein